MRIKDHKEDSGDPVNMTPMIDMVFNLLIFFLVATTFAAEERDMTLQLAKAGAPKAISELPQEIIINILEDGTTKVGARAVTGGELRKLLVEAAKANPPRKVLVRADAQSRHRYFAEVVGHCHAAGVDRVNIGYAYEEMKE
jgi:biopolymer transport protein ExbD